MGLSVRLENYTQPLLLQCLYAKKLAIIFNSAAYSLKLKRSKASLQMQPAYSL